MSYSLGKNTKKYLESILVSGDTRSSVLVCAVKEFIKTTPIDFCIIENGGYRSAQMQNKLYKRGVSKCDGYKKLSKHQSGLAVDLVPWVNNRRTWDDKYTFYLSGAFMEFCKVNDYPITTGAFWKFKDPCHMQIK